MPTTCDHVWETTKTEKVEVYRQIGEEWVHAENMTIMNICNGCDMNIHQWLIDNRNNYDSLTDADEALSILADDTGCPSGHGATNNFHTIDVTFPITTTRIYAANLPVEETCTLCGTTRACVTTKICNDANDESVSIPHTKKVVVSEAWDEELYIDCDSERYDYETGDYVPVPAGSKIDTIHHPEYSNDEVEYLENIDTGEKIHVEMISCRHPKWTRNYSDNTYFCASCNIRMPTIDEFFK